MNVKVLASILILAFVLIGIPSTLPQLTQLVKNKVGPQQKENDVIISDNSLNLDSKDSGEVVGASVDKPQDAPTPTSVRKRSIIEPTPTLFIPTSSTKNPESNSPGSNESDNSPSSQQPNTNPKSPAQNTGTSTPIPTPTSPTATTAPPTPTPDNTPFEASWETGNHLFLAIITANKPLRRCLWKQWGVNPNSEYYEGEGKADGNSCTISSQVQRTTETLKLWVKAEAVSGETKEFGDPPPF